MRFAGIFLSLVCALPARAGLVVRDDSGAEVRLKEPARRIVSLAPAITETLFAAGAGGRVVGTVEYSDYPPAAQRITRIGSYTNLDLEMILALKPDLVIGWQTGNAAEHLDAVRRMGIALFLSEPDRIGDVADDLEKFGELAGTPDVARPAAAAYRARLAELAQRYSGRPRVRTFYQIWSEPLMTVGGGRSSPVQSDCAEAKTSSANWPRWRRPFPSRPCFRPIPRSSCPAAWTRLAPNGSTIGGAGRN